MVFLHHANDSSTSSVCLWVLRFGTSEDFGEGDTILGRMSNKWLSPNAEATLNEFHSITLETSRVTDLDLHNG